MGSRKKFVRITLLRWVPSIATLLLGLACVAAGAWADDQQPGQVEDGVAMLRREIAAIDAQSADESARVRIDAELLTIRHRLSEHRASAAGYFKTEGELRTKGKVADAERVHAQGMALLSEAFELERRILTAEAQRIVNRQRLADRRRALADRLRVADGAMGHEQSSVDRYSRLSIDLLGNEDVMAIISEMMRLTDREISIANDAGQRAEPRTIALSQWRQSLASKLADMTERLVSDRLALTQLESQLTIWSANNGASRTAARLTPAADSATIGSSTAPQQGIGAVGSHIRTIR